MENVRKFFKDVKSSWKNIRFISRKNAVKRTVLVLVSMLVLGLLIMGIDWLVGNGFKALSLVSLDVSVAKTIMTVIFSISALVVIILSTVIKSTTKGFSVSNNNYYDKHRKDPQYKMNTLMIISSVACFVSAICAYIL